MNTGLISSSKRGVGYSFASFLAKAQVAVHLSGLEDRPPRFGDYPGAKRPVMSRVISSMVEVF
jgi:hypothetical protein